MKDYNGIVSNDGNRAFASGEAAPRLRAQLRADVLSRQISAESSAQFTYDIAGMRRGLTLARFGQLTRSPRERRADPDRLAEIAQAYADLADLYPSAEPARIELLAIAATMWSLAGYQANATTLARSFRLEVDQFFAQDNTQLETARAPHRIAQLTSAVLQRDIDQTALLGALAEHEVSEIGARLLDGIGNGDADQADLTVLAAYGLAGRAARSLASLWRLGGPDSGPAAIKDLRAAASLLLNASVVDTWTLVDCLAHAVEDITATTPWLLLRRSTTWGPVWNRYLKALITSGHPMTQVWPSQRAALDAGLLDRTAHSMAVTMPTSAGKTHIAEWAILHGLAPHGEQGRPFSSRPLAVYVVPTRALAAQVERHLSESLELVGLRISSLFGGAEHVSYETEILDFTDVLVVTCEKLDLLLRNLPELTERMRLVLVDEGHAIDVSERGLRLEMLLTRIRRSTPNTRIVLLSAVLPNGEDIARWLHPAGGGENQATIDWSPSQLRTGVFSWRGKATDGQRGAIDYGNSGTETFFLPRVLTRRMRRTKLFPTAPKDVAAALAVHFEKLGPVLIAAPTKITAGAAAKALQTELKRSTSALHPAADDLGDDAVRLRRLREKTLHEIGEHVGTDHELVALVQAGVAYHHADLPQPVRHCIERAYREGAIRVLCATSTLSQGMNLPTKTVIVSGTHRGQNEKVSVRDFWNTAGRAGRAFRETEGHVILIANSPSQATRLRAEYLDKSKIGPVCSTLLHLYFQLIRARLGNNIPEREQDFTALDLPDPEGQGPVLWAEGMDLQLLAQLSEEVIDTPDEQILEQAAHDLLSHTFGSSQIGAQGWSLQPLARFAARRLAGLARQLPDHRTRSAVIRTGLSVQGGLEVLDAVDPILEALQEHPGLLSEEHSADLQSLILDAASGVQEARRSAESKQIPLNAVAPMAASWMSGTMLPDLHEAHRQALGTKNVTQTSAVIDRVVTLDLAWVVSALLQVLELRRGAPAEGWLAAMPAMLKYGVGTLVACYAASLGVHNRQAAISLAARCPLHQPSFSDFRNWLNDLSRDEIASLTSPDIADHLTRNTEARSIRAIQRTILSGHGTFSVNIHAFQDADRSSTLDALPHRTELALNRDRRLRDDPDAIFIEHEGTILGKLPIEIARPLALILDDPSAPRTSLALTTDAPPRTQQTDTSSAHIGGGILVSFTLEPAD